MLRGFGAARAAMALVAAGAMLASCAQGSQRPQHYRTVPDRRASSGAVHGGPAVWRLRAGLNVAALTCRQDRGVQRDYRRMLSRHRVLLAESYQSERRRRGARFDHEQTRLYNRFANQRSSKRFCAAASNVAHEASSMDSAHLAPAAPVLVARLERGLR